jgi:Sap, sulfolipid-1-addressing protein
VAAGIGAILTYAVGVAISPMSIIAVILMLFSARARVNGPMLLPPRKAFALGLIAVAAPKNLILSLSAGTALAQVGVSTSEAVVSLIVFLVIGSTTIAGPVLYQRVGGDRAKSSLDALKDWLTVHNAAVMTVLLLAIGVKLIGDGLPGIGS